MQTAYWDTYGTYREYIGYDWVFGMNGKLW